MICFFIFLGRCLGRSQPVMTRRELHTLLLAQPEHCRIKVLYILSLLCRLNPDSPNLEEKLFLQPNHGVKSLLAGANKFLAKNYSPESASMILLQNSLTSLRHIYRLTLDDNNDKDNNNPGLNNDNNSNNGPDNNNSNNNSSSNSNSNSNSNCNNNNGDNNDNGNDNINQSRQKRRRVQTLRFSPAALRSLNAKRSAKAPDQRNRFKSPSLEYASSSSFLHSGPSRIGYTNDDKMCTLLTKEAASALISIYNQQVEKRKNDPPEKWCQMISGGSYMMSFMDRSDK